VPKVTSSNPSSISDSTFRSDLLFTGYNTLLSAPRATWMGWVSAVQIPKFIFYFKSGVFFAMFVLQNNSSLTELCPLSVEVARAGRWEGGFG
jgi:hypothetical protein